MARHPSRLAAESIVRRLRDQGHIAYFAGGCVRDELLGLCPSDYDVATDATPERIRALFRKTSHVGAAFGVVLVRDHGCTVEVATFRSDGPYSDRRRPDCVTFSDARADAQRRDFTMNALFLDPLAPSTSVAPEVEGCVIDYVDGLSDLRAGVVRAVGEPEQRFEEDHLRALRAVRFAARLGFVIDPRTFDAMHKCATELLGVSRERIGDEMRRMLTHPSRRHAMSLLVQAALDGPVFDEPGGTDMLPTLEALPAQVPFALALAAVAIDRHGLDAPLASIVGRWRSALVLSNEEQADLAAYLNLAGDIRAGWQTAPVARRKRWAGDHHFQGSLLLLSRDHALVTAIEEDVIKLRQSAGGIAPEPLLDGRALIDAGFEPGPGFGKLLDAIYDHQLEGNLVDCEQALRQARELAGRFGVKMVEGRH